MPRVFGEHLYGVGAGFVGELVADLAFYGREYKPVVGVVRGFEHQLSRFAVVLYVNGSEYAHRHIAVEFHRYFKEFLFFAAVHRKHAVPGDLVQLFHLVGVHTVNAQVVLCARGTYTAVLHTDVAYALSAFGVVGNRFGDYIKRALQRVFGGSHAFFFVYILLGDLEHAGRLFVLRVYQQRKRLQPFFLSHGSARAALGTERAVDVFYFGERFGGVQRGGNLVGHFLLLGYGSAHLFALFVQRAQVSQPLAQIAQNFVVERTGHFLAVARYERHRVAFVEQLHRRFGLTLSYAKFLCEFCNNVHGLSPFISSFSF